MNDAQLLLSAIERLDALILRMEHSGMRPVDIADLLEHQARIIRDAA